MEASRESSRTPPHLPPCSGVSVLQKTRTSHSWDTHHSGYSPDEKDQMIRSTGSNDPHSISDQAVLEWAISARLVPTNLLTSA